MELVRYTTGRGDEASAGLRGPDGSLRRLAGSMCELLRLPRNDLRQLLESADGDAEQASVRLLPPVDGLTEIWAAGVTYQRSREGRTAESAVRDVYDRVYDAQRPELFFKSPAWRVRGPGESIGIRADSAIDVPEPELALILNSAAELVGLTICNDVSSRSIEGENPLYLPQAKFYSGSCSLGPVIRPAWEVADPNNLRISVAVSRGNAVAWAAETSTVSLHRSLSELADFLFSGLDFPDGVVLSTGTGLVPDLDFTLQPGDIVEIEVEDVGVLRNTVRRGLVARDGV